MKARDLINYMIPPLKLSDDLDKVKQWMEELRVGELPVAEQGKYLGIVTEEMLINDMNNPAKVSDLSLLYQDSMIGENKHYFDVLKTAYRHGLRLVPIVDVNDQYIGVVSIENVVEAFAQGASVGTPGAIIILNINNRDYSLSEISRLIEQNGFRVLSSHISENPEDRNFIRLTLKINAENIAHLLNVFETNGYDVSEAFGDGNIQDQDQERLDSLMKYLKI